MSKGNEFKIVFDSKQAKLASDIISDIRLLASELKLENYSASVERYHAIPTHFIIAIDSRNIESDGVENITHVEVFVDENNALVDEPRNNMCSVVSRHSYSQKSLVELLKLTKE